LQQLCPDIRLTELYEKKRNLLAAGIEIIDLSMINPDLAPSRILLDRLAEASAKTGAHKYSVSRGIRRLREAFAYKYNEKFGVDSLDPENNICVTFGSKDAITQILFALAVPDKSVLVGSPLYQPHLYAIEYAGMKPCFFRISDNEEEMLFDIENKLSCNDVTSILLNFPNNPTGYCVSVDFLNSLATLAERFNVTVVNDFVYGELNHLENKNSSSLLSNPYFKDFGVETYSLSKAYNVPGWRVGAVLGDSNLVSRVAHLKSRIDFGIFLPIQFAAVAGLTYKEDIVLATKDVYTFRLNIMISILEKRGWKIKKPEAGCCIWAELPDSINYNSRDYCDKLLEHGVAAMPGFAFGSEWSRMVRFAVVVSEDKLREVAMRLDRCNQLLNSYVASVNGIV
jgi:alanine-synthesizing transaminase